MLINMRKQRFDMEINSSDLGCAVWFFYERVPLILSMILPKFFCFEENDISPRKCKF